VPPTVSLAIITKDEERDLPRCLASVPFATEVVVVDSGSTDATQELARQAGARVIEQAWLGYGPQKAVALAACTSDWVLNLDADEALSPALAAEIPAALERAGVDGYRLPFSTEMFGRTLHYGGLGGETHLRLVRRAQATMSQASVHEGLAVPGRVETLRGPVLHHPYVDLAEYLQKLDRYTTLAAQARAAAGRRFSPLSALRLPWGFFKRYLLQLGFLDGYAGFTYAALSAFYDFLKEAKLRELKQP
jgi:glycosyltransferase involved in cell wall biosynthesis